MSADDGAVLWTSTSGSGPPVVLCHGGPGMSDYLEPVAALLDDLALVHRWDQRGAGRSDPVGPFSVARCVADLDALRRHFGHERWVVVGHSWGANLAIHYARAHPGRVAAIAYICGTGLEWATYKPRYERNKAARPEDDLGPVRDHLDRFPVNHAANRAINDDMEARRLEDEQAACRLIGAPVLVVDGLDDPRPVAAVDSLVAALPNVRRVSLPACGHFPWVDQPDAFRRLLREFVASTTT